MVGGSRLQLKNLRGVRSGGTEALSVEVHGSLDATTLGIFTRGMDAVVAKGKSTIILDCAQISYVNSTGMGTLLKYSDVCRSAHGWLLFINMPERVKMVMEVLGFQNSFVVLADLAAAAEYLKDPSQSPPPAE